ncbi:MAG: response regulator [Anaerolineales bacterium]
MTKPIHVLIADDHLIVREGLRLILETVDGIVLAGEAADGVEAVRLADEIQPDVILMDLRMPKMDGLAAIKKLQATHPEVAVVILTTYNEDDLMVQGLKAGARGYLLKDTDRETLFNAIRAAARGEMLLKPEVIAKLLAHAAAPEAESEEIALTEREQEVLAAVAQGERSKEIGMKLSITERTVKAHLTNIYNKLGVDSRAAAVAEAMHRGWL